jgi:hypothetical protein
MPSGGARNRSGPQKDPTSLKSARIGHTLTSLPAAGHKGRAPAFPLPKVLVYDVWFEDKVRQKELDDRATEARRKRELELWRWAWRTPQASAWATEPWRWHSVAMWVRTSVICESADATAADKNSLHRFADQIGLTPAGLRENGWQVAADQVTEKRSEKTTAAAPAAPGARDRWLKAVGGDA